MIIKLTKSNWNKTMEENKDKPILIDFYADWCGPCKMVAPVIEQLAKDLNGKAIFAKVNIDTEVELAQQFAISSIPTFILIKDNKVVEKFTGLRNIQQLRGIVLSA